VELVVGLRALLRVARRAQVGVRLAQPGERLRRALRRVAHGDRLEQQHRGVELADLARVQPRGAVRAAGHRLDQALTGERGERLGRRVRRHAGAPGDLRRRGRPGIAEQPREQAGVNGTVVRGLPAHYAHCPRSGGAVPNPRRGRIRTRQARIASATSAP
jgi:hypothetical protein